MSPGHFDKEQKSLKLHVSELKVGMFVSKLDRDWTETPFLLQGFVIEHINDIAILEEYCEHVWIDAVEDVWIAPEDRATQSLTKRKVSYINKIPAQEEHRKALGVYREARNITKSLLDEIRLGGVIDTKKAKDTVNELSLIHI